MDSLSNLLSFMPPNAFQVDIGGSGVCSRAVNLESAEKQFKLYSSKDSETSNQLLTTTEAPYTHGIAPKPESLSHARLEEVLFNTGNIHNDKLLFLKTIANPISVISLQLLVEDVEDPDLTIFVNLYNIVTPSQKNLEEEYPIGTYLALMQPYPRYAREDRRNAVMLRCDNPQCVIFFKSREECYLAMNKNVWYQIPPLLDLNDDEATKLCEEGNKFFEQEKYRLALNKYTKSLSLSSSPTNKVRVLSNRSATLLKMNRYLEALQDADKGLKIDPIHLKLKYRKIEALLVLQDPFSAREECNNLLDLLSGKKQREIDFLSNHIDRAILESKGSYDLISIRREVGEFPRELSRRHQDYLNSALKICSGDEKGRGFFASKDIPDVYTLILAEKAYVYSPPANPNFSILSMSSSGCIDMGSSAIIQRNLVQKFLADEKNRAKLYSLSAGKYYRAFDESNKNKVDISRMKKILTNNWFDSSVEDGIIQAINSTKKGHKNRLSEGKESKGTGLWLNASLFNHSCAPNCEYRVMGDFIFIFNVRPIKKGEELTIVYCPPLITFKERKTKFSRWNEGEGFTCKCLSCKFTASNIVLQKTQKKIHEAYQNGVQMCTMGYPMNIAAKEVTKKIDMNSLILQLQKIPLEATGNCFQLLELRSFCSDDCHEVLYYQNECLKMIEAVHGESILSLDRLKCLIRICSFALMCNNENLARNTMKKCHTELCLSKMRVLTTDEFLVLLQRYDSVGLYSQMRRLIIDKKNIKLRK